MGFGKILGIDEAGKGAVLGDLFIVGVCTTEINYLKYKNNPDIKDSKKLSKSRRKIFYNKFIADENLEIIIKRVTPKEIDSKNLNHILFEYNLQIIKEAKATINYLDCPWISPIKFKNNLLENLDVDTKIIAEHKADNKYKIVSMASIIAKYLRDLHIRKLELERLKILGSGYPADEKTINFIKENRNDVLIRKKWNLKNL